MKIDRDLLSRYDQFDPAQTQFMHEMFSYAREQCPVFRAESGRGHWVVTRYDDGRKVLSDVKTFSNYDGITPHGEGMLPNLPAASDPPLHGQYRDLMRPFLGQPGIRRHEPALRKLAEEVIGRWLRNGEVELVREFAEPYALGALFESVILVRDADLIQRFTEAGDLVVLENSVNGFQSVIAAVQEYMRRRRHQPDDRGDLFDAVEAAMINGKPLSEEQKIGILINAFGAGFETNLSTMSLIMDLVARRPELEPKIQGADWARQNFHEFLRYLTPVTGLYRTLVADTELAGCPMKKGEKVMVHYASVNRDEARFPDAGTLHFERQNAGQHMAFSFGIHRCLGAQFAELVIGIGLDELTKRATNFRLKNPEASPPYTAGLVRRLPHVHLLFDVR